MDRGGTTGPRRGPPPARTTVRAGLRRNSAVPDAQLARTRRATRAYRRRNSHVPEAQLNEGSGEGGAHGGEGGGEAGELLELEGGLVDEEVEAGDQYLVPAGPGGGAADEPGVEHRP